MEKPDLILFDWDMVIFNYLPLKKEIFDALAKAGIPENIIPETYGIAKGDNYGYTLKGHEIAATARFPHLAGEVKKVFESLHFELSKYVFPDARSFITKYSGIYPCGVLTAGDPEFQQQKIDQSGLVDHFKEIKIVSYTTAVESKVAVIRDFLTRYPRILYFDDRMDMIRGIAKNFSSDVVMQVWVNRSGAKERLPDGVREVHALTEIDPQAIF